MKVEIKLPDFWYGEGEIVLVSWTADIGDIVHEEQPLLEVSCDKELFSVYSPVEGVVERILCFAGQSIQQEEVLGIIETDIASFKP